MLGHRRAAVMLQAAVEPRGPCSYVVPSPSPCVTLLPGVAITELLVCSRLGWLLPAVAPLFLFCLGKVPLKGSSFLVGLRCHPPSSHLESWELRKHTINWSFVIPCCWRSAWIMWKLAC